MESGMLPVRVAGRRDGSDAQHTVSRLQPNSRLPLATNRDSRRRRPRPGICLYHGRRPYRSPRNPLAIHDGTFARGTLLTESFEFLWCSIANRTLEMFLPRGRQMNRGIHETLVRIKRAAEPRKDRHEGHDTTDRCRVSRCAGCRWLACWSPWPGRPLRTAIPTRRCRGWRPTTADRSSAAVTTRHSGGVAATDQPQQPRRPGG